MSNSQYYSLDRILERKAQYNMVIGERSNGKTFAVLKHAIERYARDGSQLAIVRRFKDDFIGKRGAEMFSALTAEGVIKEATGGKWTGVYYYSSRWYLCRYVEDKKGNERRVTAEDPFAFGFALTSMEHDKGVSYPNVRTIMFDEFLTRSGYLPDEFILFTNVLSTIIRQRDDVTIFMLGNTVNKYCPYFAEMGLKHIKDMEQGDIDLYRFGNGKLKVAVEYCGEARRVKKKSDVYFAFDNPKLEMITKGVWELDVYPHLPYKYTQKNVVFMFFIDFEGETLQVELVLVEGSYFAFVHRKTGEIKHPETDLVYTPRADARPNWRRRITEPTELSRRLYQFWLEDKVFYQDNNVGEVVRNYLEWCRKA